MGWTKLGEQLLGVVTTEPPPAPVAPPPPPSEIEWLGRMTSVSLEPDDVLVLMSPLHLSDMAFERLTANMKEHFPDHKTIILEEGLTPGVIRKESP